MPEDKDTAAIEAAETESSEVIGTDVDESTDAPITEEVKEEVETVDPAELEKLREEKQKLEKEKQKIEMEINLRRNEAEKAKKERIAAEEDAEKRAELYRQELEELTARTEKEKQEKATEDLREKVLGEYPDVADLAKSLNLYWDDAEDFTAAEAQLRVKMDALQAKFDAAKPAEDDSTPTVHSNNPRVDNSAGVEFEELSLEEMRKVLPRAESR